MEDVNDAGQGGHGVTGAVGVLTGASERTRPLGIELEVLQSHVTQQAVVRVLEASAVVVMTVHGVRVPYANLIASAGQAGTFDEISRLGIGDALPFRPVVR